MALSGSRGQHRGDVIPDLRQCCSTSLNFGCSQDPLQRGTRASANLSGFFPTVRLADQRAGHHEFAEILPRGVGALRAMMPKLSQPLHHISRIELSGSDLIVPVCGEESAFDIGSRSRRNFLSLSTVSKHHVLPAKPLADAQRTVDSPRSHPCVQRLGGA